MSSIPTFVAPSTKTWLGIGREDITGTPVMPSYTVPLDKATFEPEDTPRFLPDEAIRGSMALLYQEILGPEDATFTYGGPFFGDVYGYFFDNTFGDLSTTGTTTTGGSSTLAAATAVGATTATVVTPTGFAAAQNVQIDTGSVAEVVTLSNVAGSVLTFATTPLRFAHNSGATAVTVTAPYTHRWAILNSGNGQPPTHTVTDYTALTPTVGARQYPSLCVAQCDFTGNAEQLLMVKVTGNSWVSAPASTTPTIVLPSTIPLPNWRSTVTIGGSQVYNVGEWSISIKRQLEVYFTAQGYQNPFIIARGPLDASGVINYTVAQDETPLTEMLNNTQPAMAISIGNGYSGASEITMTFTCSQAAFIKSKPVRTAVLFGYEDGWQAVANSTDSGGSGGVGPCTITLVNAIPTY